MSFCLFLFQIKAPAETLHPASTVENTLLTSKERMALRANIHAEVLPDAPCFKRISTSARHRCFNKVGVNSSFHLTFSQSFRRNGVLHRNGRPPCQSKDEYPRGYDLEWHCTRRLHSRQATTNQRLSALPALDSRYLGKIDTSLLYHMRPKGLGSRNCKKPGRHLPALAFPGYSFQSLVK